MAQACHDTWRATEKDSRKGRTRREVCWAGDLCCGASRLSALAFLSQRCHPGFIFLGADRGWTFRGGLLQEGPRAGPVVLRIWGVPVSEAQ